MANSRRASSYPSSHVGQEMSHVVERPSERMQRSVSACLAGHRAAEKSSGGVSTPLPMGGGGHRSSAYRSEGPSPMLSSIMDTFAFDSPQPPQPPFETPSVDQGGPSRQLSISPIAMDGVVGTATGAATTVWGGGGGTNLRLSSSMGGSSSSASLFDGTGGGGLSSSPQALQPEWERGGGMGPRYAGGIYAGGAEQVGVVSPMNVCPMSHGQHGYGGGLLSGAGGGGGGGGGRGRGLLPLSPSRAANRAIHMPSTQHDSHGVHTTAWGRHAHTTGQQYP